MDLTKYPVNERGFTVVPCIALTYENMSDDLIGYTVTIGLGEVGVPTSSGIIEGYTETKLKVKVGSKIKLLPYDPNNIELQVYQFEKRVLFSNEVPNPRRTERQHEKEEKDVKPTPAPVKKKSTKAKSSPKKSSKSSKPKSTKSQYKPKFGIVWEN